MAPRRSKEERPLKRFYEVLVLLLVLGQIQGGKVPGEPLDDEAFGSIEAADMRRKVMHHLCVMCDFLKGGDTVTAMASENLPQGPRYWVAANSLLDDKIKPFLLGALHSLEILAVSESPDNKRLAVERELFGTFVAFHQKRIKKYWKLLQQCITNELGRARSSPIPHAHQNEYVQWLEHFQDRPKEAEDFCSLSEVAYTTRHSEFLRVDFDPISARPVRFENGPRSVMRHYIGRLCAPMRAARLLTHAAASYPFMFDGFTIETVPTGSPSVRPSEDDLLTLDGISGRMFRMDAPELDVFRKALQLLDNTGSIMSRVLAHYRDKNWQPRVHAELALLEAIHGHGFVFCDGDRFIACSKPACFCCYHYICSHPGSFARPQCHNKVYLNWQPPSRIVGCNSVSAEQQREIMIKVTQQVREAAIGQVLGTERGRRWHPDSSTGITPGWQLGIEARKSPRLAAADLDSGNPQEHLPTSSVRDSDFEDSDDGGVALALA